MPKTKSTKEIQEKPLEKQLWKAADKLRKNIDAAEYKHVVLGLIFLKYILAVNIPVISKRIQGTKLAANCH
jgi:type I restriction-modification system DNA methylase subunit